MKHRTSNIENPASNSKSRGCGPAERWAAALNLRQFCVALAVFLCGFGNGHAQVSREYQLKAVFLYNFAQFTEWPDDAFATDKSPLVIGVIGSDPFGHSLENTIKGETIQGHPLVIQHYHRADEIKACHILFISQSENRQLDEIVRSLKEKPTLTVADADGPASAAVMIRFMVENNKVHFRINQRAATNAHLILSSRLLRVADATPPGGSP